MLCPHMILGLGGQENQETVKEGRVVDLPPWQCLDGVHLRIHGFEALFSSQIQVRCNFVLDTFAICVRLPPPLSLGRGQQLPRNAATCCKSE